MISQDKEIKVIVWPYEDCKIFTKGDIVFYQTHKVYSFEKHKILTLLRFWHPEKKAWLDSSRPTIMEDACSITTIGPKMIQDSHLGAAINYEKKIGLF